MIHCEKCLAVFTNSVGSGTVLCKECQAKGDSDIFDTQPTCGEISCDECNERYEKAMERIKALEDVVRELTGWGDYDLTVIKKYNDDWGAMRDKALKLVNGGK